MLQCEKFISKKKNTKERATYKRQTSPKFNWSKLNQSEKNTRERHKHTLKNPLWTYSKKTCLYLSDLVSTVVRKYTRHFHVKFVDRYRHTPRAYCVVVGIFRVWKFIYICYQDWRRCGKKLAHMRLTHQNIKITFWWELTQFTTYTWN